MRTRAPELMCRVKKYPSEEAARRAIWAMKQNRLAFAENLKPRKCETCSAGREDVYHTVPIKPWSETKHKPKWIGQ